MTNKPNICGYGFTKDHGVECPYDRQNLGNCTIPENESGLCDLITESRPYNKKSLIPMALGYEPKESNRK